MTTDCIPYCEERKPEIKQMFIDFIKQAKDGDSLFIPVKNTVWYTYMHNWCYYWSNKYKVICGLYSNKPHGEGYTLRLFHRLVPVARDLLRLSKNSAYKRNLKHNLTLDYICNIIKSQNYCCAITKIKLSNKRGDNSPELASLDRIDSSKGYIRGNVQVVQNWVNKAKGDTDNETFKENLYKTAKKLLTYR